MMTKAVPQIYFDNSATTPLHPQVLEAMMPFLTEKFGNASSHHVFGYDAKKAVGNARVQVAELVGCEPNEIFWTSGATESNNLALFGTAHNFSKTDFHALSCQTEHQAVLQVMESLKRQDFEISILQSNHYGQIDLDDVEKNHKSETKLISFMAANNEVGSINPIEALGDFARHSNILFHCDAAQALGKIPLDFKRQKVDLASFSAHKLYGPKGLGALFVRKGVQVLPQLKGGHQENGLRPGTLNVPGIVGFGEACRLAQQKMTDESLRLKKLADLLLSRIQHGSLDVILNGHPTDRLPGHLSLTAPHLHGDDLSLVFSQFAFSRGSACSGGKASYVLAAMGIESSMAERAFVWVLVGKTRKKRSFVLSQPGRIIAAANSLLSRRGTCYS